MTTEPQELHPERQRLETLIAITEKRITRAAVKKRAAERDMDEALDDREAAQARLAQWIKANPEAQMTIFEVISA
jgi:peptidoglycan hydrolase CwlO-like protein